MVEIYDDVVSPAMQDKIESGLTHSQFPWYLSTGYNHSTVSKAYQGNDPMLKEYMQFVHPFVVNRQNVSPSAALVRQLFTEFTSVLDIKHKTIHRIKANLQSQCNFSQTDFYNTPHLDEPFQHTVAIYYVNDTDGDLRVFTKEEDLFTIVKEIEPKKGRLVVFDGSLYHAGRHPVDAVKRIAINFNFI
jgi:hypothetical protein